MRPAWPAVLAWLLVANLACLEPVCGVSAVVREIRATASLQSGEPYDKQSAQEKSGEPLSRKERRARKRAEAKERASTRDNNKEAFESSVGLEARLQRVEVEERDGEALLTLSASQAPKWLAGERPDGGLTLQLLRTLPENGLALPALQSGIVAGVELSVERTGEAPTTLVEIATQAPVSYAVRPIDDGISVRLRLRPASRSALRDVVKVITPSQLNDTASNAEYRVGAGDLLQFEVFGLPELSRKIRVDAAGTINFPIVGSVEVVDLTLQQAETKLAELLSVRGLVNDPVVAIAVDELVSRGVSLQGAVQKPGLYQLYGSKTLLELLVETGGLAEGASSGRTILVFRRGPAGEQLRAEIDAERLLGQGDLSLNVELQPGDIVQVPAPRRLRVYVSGAVRTPGPVDYLGTDGITLLQAITSAGGPTERARLGAVQVIRRHDDGTEERFEFDVKKISNGKTEDFSLERGDTIVVKDWFF